MLGKLFRFLLILEWLISLLSFIFVDKNYYFLLIYRVEDSRVKFNFDYDGY